jgi:uncharacterized membrane protein YqjE
MARAVPTPPEGEKPIKEQSVPELVREILKDSGDLAREEFQLFKTELQDTVRQSSTATGTIVVGAVAAVLGIGYLGLCLILLLSLVIPQWVSALIIGIIFIAAGAGIAYWGYTKFRKMNVAPLTKETLKEDAEWLKHPTKPEEK